MVELVVALTVLAIGIVAVAGVMHSSAGVAIRTNQRSRAVALATREVESVRAVPYAQLDTGEAVATRTETSGNTTFTIQRAVTWAAQGTNPRAVKQTTVSVAWTDGGVTREVHQTSFVYPGGLGPVATVPPSDGCDSGAGTPLAPTLLVATVPTGLSGETGVDLLWTPAPPTSVPVTAWKIEMSTDGFATSQLLSQTQPSSSSSYRAEGLAAGTDYQFRVAAMAACAKVSAWSPVASATTNAAAAAACELGTPKVTPAAVKRSSGALTSGLEVSPNVTVNTTGDCTGLQVRYSPTTGINAVLPMTGSGGVYAATIAAGGAWDVGVHPLDLHDATGTKRASLLLTVCAHNAKQCG